jgi:hypothetical protein
MNLIKYCSLDYGYEDDVFYAWLSRGRFRTDGRSDDGRGGVRDLDAL